MFGGSVLLHERFDPERVLSELQPGGPSSVFLVPTMFAAMHDLGETEPSEAELTIMSNASALPERLKHYAVEQWPKARIFEIYGSTEGGTISSLRPEDLLRKPRCVGQPLALTEVELRDSEGNPVATGDVGQLWSRSPYIFERYLGRPEETAQVRVDGWVTCGDLARADDEGYLHIVGRTTDTIITGGVNVFPREVEEVIRDLDGVVDAVVLGLPDPRWGERVHAVVVKEDDAVLEAADIDRHCRRLLAGPKIPRGITIRRDVPRTPTGKVLRAALIDELREHGDDAAS
jgi:long-chain acyl-CoA synthetase